LFRFSKPEIRVINDVFNTRILVESPSLVHNDNQDRALMKANLILTKTIPKNYEHKEEIKFLENQNQGVKRLF